MGDRVNNLYECSQRLKRDMKVAEQNVADLKAEYDGCITAYRIASVNRVLEHIDYQVRNGHSFSSKRLSTLMVHCQNKLNGNIDGIELSLSLDEEDDL